MIDIHNHSLPGLDDGAKGIEQSIDMCRMAIDCGISHIIMTPHIDASRFNNSLPLIREACEGLKLELDKNKLPLSIAFSAEVMCSDNIIGLVESGSIPFLGKWEGKDVMLMEFPYYHLPLGLDKLITWLLSKNVIPMIAHPERNKALTKNSKTVMNLIRQGCLMQITSGSLLGKFGETSKRFAEYLLEEGLVTVVATDAHNCARRAPDLHLAADEITRIADANTADKLVHHHPWNISKLHFE